MSSDDFSSLNLSIPLLKALKELGYEQPSPIQSKSIPVLLGGKNLLGTAQTGTGKTAAFALPFLNNIDEKLRAPQVLVLTPTRELAIQVAQAFQGYAKYIKGFHVLPIYGGTDISTQLRSLKKSPQVIVGTPGRMLDHLRRRSLNLSQIKGLVLDEADEMLRMGFIDDVETILSKIPDNCQRALFSATMPATIRKVANTYLGDAQQVSIKSKTKTVESIKQQYVTVHGHQKIDALTSILEVESFDGVIIFVRTKSSTVTIAEKLEARGFLSAAINGDLNQALRERTINHLKQGQIDIVVATDVAARGLDVDRISHVINFDIPHDNESYVHRIGRTGRAGRDGKAILFITPKESRLLRSIERSTGQAILPLAMPTSKEISDQRIQQFTQKLLKTMDTSKERLDKFRDIMVTFASDNQLDMIDIATALTYESQKDRPLFPKLDNILLKPQLKDRNKTKSSPKKPRNERIIHDEDGEAVPLITYRLEVGTDDGAEPSKIVGAIANEADISSKHIGRIKLYNRYSTVDLPKGMPDKVFNHLKKTRINAKPLKISIFNGDDHQPSSVIPKTKRHRFSETGNPKSRGYSKKYSSRKVSQ
jgi:ATP-dependent RNA helicase DeaD